MRRRSSFIALVLCAAGALPSGFAGLPTGGSVARAQTLDLTPPTPKARATGRAMTRAVELEREANRLNAPSDAVTPFSASHDLARARVRLLAAMLLREGEKRGPDGSRLVLAGTMLSDDLADLDRWISPSNIGEPAVKEVATRIDDLLKVGLNESSDLDRALHTALGPLLPERSAGMNPSWWPGMPEAGRRSSPIISSQRIAEQLKFDTDHSARAESVDTWINAAVARSADSPIALRHMRRISTASRGWTEPPAWVSASARERLAQDARDTLSRVAEAPTSIQADLATRRAAAIAEVLGRTDDLAGVAQSRAIRPALNGAITLLGNPSPAEVDRWLLLRDALRLTDPSLVPDASTLQPISRMAILQMTPAVRRARDQLLGALPRLLVPEPVITDPGILNAVAALRRKVGEATSVVRLGESLRAAREADAQKDGRFDAARATKIEQLVLARAQEFNRPDTRDLALARLLELDEELAACLGLPGESQLRDVEGASIYRALAGERRELLLVMVDARRKVWLDAIAAAVPRKPIAERLTEVGPAWNRYFQLAVATSAGVPAALQDWGGWHMSLTGVSALAAGAEEAKARADRAIDVGDWSEFVAGVNSIPVDHPALVMGRLALAADRTRPPLDAQDPGLGVPPASLLKLARGGADPDESWLVDGLDAVARMCVAADDLAAMRRATSQREGARPGETAKPDVKALELMVGRLERASSLLASHLDADEAWRRLRR